MTDRRRQFYKGVDVSTLRSVLADGGKFYADGEKDIFSILADNGINSVRVRIWNQPCDEQGKPYEGGNCDLSNLLWLAKKVKQSSMSLFLCLHYSDFWVDPGKQYAPKQWANYDYESTCKAVYQYTCFVLDELSQIDCTPELVQIGNEITNGLIWPLGKITETGGKRGNFDKMCGLLNAGAQAVREKIPQAKIVLHLENSCNNAIYREWLDNAQKYSVDYDILGVSYYSNWHGSINVLKANLADVSARYGKQIIIAETAYAYTFEPTKYSCNGTNSAIINSGLLLDEKVIFPFPVTKSGQKQFFEALFDLCDELNLLGIFAWEPAWIPTPHGCWASKEGRKYINENDKQGGNEWCNQCLFDYEGGVLPALSVFKRSPKTN